MPAWSAAPLATNTWAWKGLRAERTKLSRWGSPARINTRPRWSQTTAWTRCTDSRLPPRSRRTSNGGTPGRWLAEKLLEKLIAGGDPAGGNGPLSQSLTEAGPRKQQAGGQAQGPL